MPSERKSIWVLEALRRYERPLLRYASAIVGPTLANDVVQDTFMRLCDQAQEDVEGRLGAWLYTVCRNRAIELRREDTRVDAQAEVDDMQSEADGPGEALERKEDVRRVMAALSSLPERQREAILLKFSGDLSYQEMAEVLGISVSNVGFILHTAMRALRERVEKSQRESERRAR